MSRPIGTELPEEVVNRLAEGCICAIATVDEDGRPHICLMGGVTVIDSKTVRLPCWGTGTTAANIRRTGLVMVETLGPMAVAFRCRARVVKDPMESSLFPPHPYCLFEAKVEEVKDDAPRGLRLVPLSYDWDPQMLEKMGQTQEQAQKWGTPNFMDEVRQARPA